MIHIRLVSLILIAYKNKNAASKSPDTQDAKRRDASRLLTSISAVKIQTWIHTCCQFCQIWLMLFSIKFFCVRLSGIWLWQSESNCAASRTAWTTSVVPFNWCVWSEKPAVITFYARGVALCQPETHLLSPQAKILNGSSLTASTNQSACDSRPHLQGPALNPEWRKEWQSPLIGNGSEDAATCNWFVVSKATKWKSSPPPYFEWQKLADSTVRWCVTFIQMSRRRIHSQIYSKGKSMSRSSYWVCMCSLG